MGIEPSISVINYELDEKFARDKLSACLVPRFFTGERVGQRGFLQVLVTGIVTNLKQKIPSQITGKIMFKLTGHFYSYRLFTGNL